MFAKILLLVGLTSSVLSCDRRPLASIKAYITVVRRLDRPVIRYVEGVRFENLMDYRSIDVTNTTIPELCESSVRNLENLETLSMISVGITNIYQRAFRNVPRLKYLSLSLNKISYIQEGVFNELPLHSLYLSANKIEEIHAAAFDNMPYLRVIHLDRNKIRRIDGRWFANSPSLRIVDFNFNGISEVPRRAFENLHPDHGDLVMIKLQHNAITRVHHKSFRGDEHNWVLQLTKNNISGFLSEDLYEAVRHLREVDLRGNQIDCVPDEVNNRISNTMLRINIRDNPISCVCLRRLRQYFRIQRNVVFSTTINCFSL